MQKVACGATFCKIVWTKPSETGVEDELLAVFRAYGLPEPARNSCCRCRVGGLLGRTVRRDGTDDIRLRPAGIAAEVAGLPGLADVA